MTAIRGQRFGKGPPPIIRESSSMNAPRHLMSTLLGICIALSVSGCGGKQESPAANPRAKDQPAAQNVPEWPFLTKFQPGEPCQIAIPNEEHSIPAWAGARSDEPFDVRQYHIDWQQKFNPDAVCLYLTALAEISSDVAALVPEEVRERQLARQAAAFAMISELVPTDQSSLADTWNETRARELINTLRPALDLVDKAQQQPSCVFFSGLHLTDTLPHLQGARVLSRLGRIELHALRTGEFEATERVVRRLLHLARDLRPHGGIIHQLISYTIETHLVSSTLEEILTRPGLTVAQCRLMRRLFEQHDSLGIDSLLEGTRAEYVVAANTLWELEHGTLSFSEFDANISPKTAKAINYDVEWKSLNELYASLFQDFRDEPYHVALKGSRFAKRMDTMRRSATEGAALSVLLRGKLSNSALVILLAPSMDQFREALARREVRLGAIRSLLVVREFELKHHRLPSSLEEAFQDAGEIPADPYSGGKLKYRVIDRSVRVYAVGVDQKDDQAEEDWGFGERPGDFILQMPSLN